MQQFDVVCVSHLWWEWVWQRPQHLITRLARRQRVFWAEEPHVEIGAPGEVFEVNEVQPNLQISRLIRRGDTATFQSLLRETLERTGAKDFKLADDIREASLLFDSPVQEGLERYVAAHVQGWRRHPLVLWLYSPMVVGFIDLLKPDLVVFDVMDELSSFQFAPPLLKQRDQELMERADLVFTGGPSIYANRRTRHHDVHLFPSGVEQGHFAQALDPNLPAPDAIANLQPPVIGFFGVIDERIDLDLLAKAAVAHPEWQFAMIGPVLKIEQDVLPRRPNIHYLGKQDYADLPAFLKHFDVAMLPFARNESTRFISPTKTLEYLAAHKPVVSTPIADVMTLYGPAVEIAETPEQFGIAVERLLGQNEHEREARVATAREWLDRYAWDTIAGEMEGLIKDRLGRKLRGAS